MVGEKVGTVVDVVRGGWTGRYSGGCSKGMYSAIVETLFLGASFTKIAKSDQKFFMLIYVETDIPLLFDITLLFE